MPEAERRLLRASRAKVRPDSSPPCQADRALVREVERRRDQDQAGGDQSQQHPLGRPDALPEDQAFEQRDEGGEAGEAQRGDGDAADLDRNEEGDPVRGQQRPGDHQHEQLRGRQDAQQGLAPHAGEYAQRNHREDRPPQRDDGGAGLDQLPEDAGQAE